MYRVNSRQASSACASVVGMALLCFVCGAAVMHFHLPSSGWLHDAFLGARIWQECHPVLVPVPHESDKVKKPDVRPNVDRPGKTFDGFTLYTCVEEKDSGMQAHLANMRGEVVHRWAIQPGQIRGESYDASHDNAAVCFFGTYLYPNGDLLVVLSGQNSRDCGLAKLDAQSNLIWFCPRTIHHDVDVAEDGTIYAVADELSYDRPERLESIATPYMADILVALSPDGELLREPISILSALCDSPYAALLAPLEEPDKSRIPPLGSTAPRVERRLTHPGLNDAMHTNCVRVLPADLAVRFPAFEAGQVLVSVRNLNVIAMLDPIAGRVMWAARGPWLAQHDPQFLDNGHLLIFDNLGSPRGSRVLEYDPQTQALPWSYSGTVDRGLYTSERGMNQRLPNGNTFIVGSEGGEMIEIASDGEVVWSHSLDRFIASARRYSAEQLHFLPPNTHSRP